MGNEYVLFLQMAEVCVPEIDQNILEEIIEKETVIEKEITTEENNNSNVIDHLGIVNGTEGIGIV
jgi:hypothetical protein